MNFLDGNLLWTFLAAFAGGYVGVKLKIPAGALIGALLATVGVRFLGVKAREVPYIFSFVAQVFIGLIIGAVVALFHFLRIIVVLITAPIVLYFLGK